jgi:hypothetical protein
MRGGGLYRTAGPLSTSTVFRLLAQGRPSRAKQAAWTSEGAR